MKGLYEVTVNRGEDIRQVISGYILEKGWEEVFIVGAVGSIIDSAYNAPIDNSIPMNLATNECPRAAELLSFNGEVMKRERMDDRREGRKHPISYHPPVCPYPCQLRHRRR